jgi:hypothetical protein
MVIMADPVFRPIEPLPDGEPEGPFVRRLAWFAGIALASMLVVAAVAYSMRTLLFL